MIGQNLKGRFGIDAEFYTDKLGTAYKATDTQEGTPVVVFVLDEQVSTGGDAVSALLASSGTVRELESPLLVPTTGSGLTDDGKIFLVMPLPDAVPLKSLVKGGIPIEQVVDLARQIATAGSIADEAGLQHLDLSGNSILISVLSDSGQVARVTRHGYQSLLPVYSTAKKNLPFYGTPEYMAPELCSGKGPDPRSDIYSLGILMYEMVVGKCPFVSNNVQTVLKRQIFEKPLPLHLLKRGVAGISEFEKIVFQALQKMPARRQESMAQLVEQLDGFRAEFLAEAELTPMPQAVWSEIRVEDAAPAPAPEEAAAEAERRPAETMMFAGITPEQAAATEPDASAAAAEAISAETETLKMQYAQAEKLVEEPVAEHASERAEEDTTGMGLGPEESDKKTLMMAPIPAAATEADAQKAAASALRSPAGAEADDWFVDSGHDLTGKEQPHSWGEQKSGSNLKFFLAMGIIAALIVVLIVVVMGKRKGDGALTQEETQKSELDPAMKRQLDQERKVAEARKAELATAAKIRAEIEADKAAKARAAAEDAARKEAAAAADAEQKAVLDAKRTELTDRFLAVRTEAQGFRHQLSERRFVWAEKSAEDKTNEIDQAIMSLDRIIAPEKMKKLANDMVGEQLKTVESRLQRIEGQIAAFKVRSDRLLAEPAAIEGEAAKVAEEEAAKVAEEEAAKELVEEEAVATEKAAAEKAAAEKAAAEKAAAEKAAAEKAAAEKAAAEKVGTEESAAEKAAAKKAAAKKAAAKKAAAEKAAAEKAAAEKAAAEKAVDQGKALMKEGISTYKKGRWDEAVATFEKAKAAGGNAALADKYIAKAKKKKAEARDNQAAGEAAKKKAAAEKAAAEKAAAEKAAAEKAAAEKVAAEKAAEDAAKKKAAEDAAKKKAAEDAAKKKAAEDAAKKKAAEDAAKKADSSKDAAKAKKYMKLGISAYKKGSHALAIKYFEKAGSYADDPALANRWVDKVKKAQAGD